MTVWTMTSIPTYSYYTYLPITYTICGSECRFYFYHIVNSSEYLLAIEWFFRAYIFFFSISLVSNFITMMKQTTKTNLSILNAIDVFNSISKCIGFAVTKPNDTFSSKFLREIIFLWFLLLSLFSTIRSELWCLGFLNLKFSVKKIIIFVVDQIIILSPFGCFLCFRLCNLPIWKILSKIRRLEKKLSVCNAYLKTRLIGFVGLFFWSFQFFIIMSVLYYSLWPSLTHLFIIDVICMFYFQAAVTVSYLQFVSWFWLLSHVSYCLQVKIIEINELQYLMNLDFCRVKCRVTRITWDDCNFVRMIQTRRIIKVLNDVSTNE